MDGNPGRNVSASWDRLPLRLRPGIIDIGEGGAALEGPIPDEDYAGGDGNRGQRGTVPEGGITNGGHARGDEDGC